MTIQNVQRVTSVRKNCQRACLFRRQIISLVHTKMFSLWKTEYFKIMHKLTENTCVLLLRKYQKTMRVDSLLKLTLIFLFCCEEYYVIFNMTNIMCVGV